MPASSSSPMNVCRSKSCGILRLIEEELSNSKVLHSGKAMLFVGVDVSTKFTGMVCLSMHNNKPTFESAVLVPMPTKQDGSMNKNQILHTRFDDLVRGFEQIKQQQHVQWEVTVEDKILLPSKGAVGSHSLAECIVSARIAAKQVFTVTPNIASPLTARAGLGLNDMSSGSSRAKTKQAVVDFAKMHCPALFKSKAYVSAGETDLADAYMLAISALRTALQREMCANIRIQNHFRNCHEPTLRASCTPKDWAMGKVDLEISSQLHTRMPKWLDSIWLVKQLSVM